MKKGFTLIEILITVGIIGLFSRFIFTSFDRIDSETEKGIEETKNLYIQLKSIYIDNVIKGKYLDCKKKEKTNGEIVECNYLNTIVGYNIRNQNEVYTYFDNKNQLTNEIKYNLIITGNDDIKGNSEDGIETPGIIKTYTPKSQIHIADIIFHNDNEEIELKWCYPPQFSGNCE